MSGITIDVSEIRELAHLLGAAADATFEEASEAVDEVAHQVHAEARANAASFHTASTGELAGSVDVQVTGTGARIFSNVRQAYFLEYGSPKTGAPRPWLTEPAERGSTELLKRIAKAGDIW